MKNEHTSFFLSKYKNHLKELFLCLCLIWTLAAGNPKCKQLCSSGRHFF